MAPAGPRPWRRSTGPPRLRPVEPRPVAQDRRLRCSGTTAVTLTLVLVTLLAALALLVWVAGRMSAPGRAASEQASSGPGGVEPPPACCTMVP